MTPFQQLSFATTQLLETYWVESGEGNSVLHVSLCRTCPEAPGCHHDVWGLIFCATSSLRQYKVVHRVNLKRWVIRSHDQQIVRTWAESSRDCRAMRAVVPTLPVISANSSALLTWSRPHQLWSRVRRVEQSGGRSGRRRHHSSAASPKIWGRTNRANLIRSDVPTVENSHSGYITGNALSVSISPRAAADRRDRKSISCQRRTAAARDCFAPNSSTALHRMVSMVPTRSPAMRQS